MESLVSVNDLFGQQHKHERCHISVMRSAKNFVGICQKCVEGRHCLVEVNSAKRTDRTQRRLLLSNIALHFLHSVRKARMVKSGILRIEKFILQGFQPLVALVDGPFEFLPLSFGAPILRPTASLRDSLVNVTTSRLARARGSYGQWRERDESRRRRS